MSPFGTRLDCSKLALRLEWHLNYMFYSIYNTSLTDGYDRSNSTHHQLLCSVLMTACDLCFNTKSWEVSEELSSLLYREFFTQGDLEKALGETPLEMMDKDKAYIPAQQVGFLNGIAGPVYE